MSEKMKFGLIGCGGQGRYLSDALNITGLAEMAACADLIPEKAEEAAEQCGYKKTYTDADEMLEKADLDAVIVATIHDQLQPCGMQVVEAGKHLFVEKPMALNAADGRALCDAAKKAGVKIMVGYTLPFLPARVRMKQLLDQGAIGDIAHVTAGQLIGAMGGWLGTPEHGGGPLLYVGTHALYQVLDVVEAPATRVFAEVDFTDEGVDAWCQFTIRFEGGIAAQMTTSQRMGGRYGWIDIIGSDGLLRSEWESNQLVVQSRKVPEYKERTTIDVEATATGPAVKLGTMASVTGFKYVRAWAAEFMEFIAAIQEDRDPRITGEDAVRVLEICDAVIESGKTGRAMEL
ncbi:MAG: Gfo/Idh/MocA family oxidoreductase [Planctomycetes bacterium]|nr:Gfo/Idh/MocA family oxidoreductase [Planctomycetota bacterium]